MNDEIMIKIENVSKEYRLGQIGGTTLREELQRTAAKILHKEDPTKKINAEKFETGETFLALDGVSFEVKKGERVGIIGHNGAGKSTLLKLLSRVTAPTCGEIGLNGRVASMLEVGTGFNGELTGRENIFMNGAILGMSKKEISEKIEDIIEFSECRQFIDTPVKRYSSGMYVKLAFSVAAHLNSEIMIMDEVLAVGDMAFQKKCLDKMNDVSRADGRTILYVSHNMNTIRQLCDRVIVLDHGKVVYDGDVERGIGIYLNRYNEEIGELCIDYEKIPRFEWLKDTYVRTLYAELHGKTNPVYTDNEPMVLLLKWVNERDVDNLCLRIEILDSDRKPICTAICFDFYSGKKGEYATSKFEVNISQIVKGKFSTYYTFFIRDSLGTCSDVDNIMGLSFEKADTKSNIEWRSNVWGHLHLPDAKLIE